MTCCRVYISKFVAITISIITTIYVYYDYCYRETREILSRKTEHKVIDQSSVLNGLQKISGWGSNLGIIIKLDSKC